MEVTVHARSATVVAIASLASAVGAARAQTPDDDVAALVAGEPFQSAVAFLTRDYDRFVAEMIRLTEIPAPPLAEQERALAYLEMLREHRLADVEMDAEGNVMGVRRGTGRGPMLAVIAHLDTVFLAGTDVTVKRAGTRLLAPGVGDDSRGLALMLAVLRALDGAGVLTANDILFVGSVGEEGVGDLRGARFLFQEGRYAKRIGQVIAIDLTNESTDIWRVANAGIGVIRYRVTFRGPGGHSYEAFGLVNPANALADAITALSRSAVPQEPKTTFNVGVVGGGTSVNSIPSEVWMDVELRSESSEELERLEKALLAGIDTAVARENARGSTASGAIASDVKVIGRRPAGQTPVSSPLVRTVAAAARAFGFTPEYRAESTDANIPLSIGIAAVTIGRGPGGRAHSVEEWTDVEPESVLRAQKVVLASVLGAAGSAPATAHIN